MNLKDFKQHIESFPDGTEFKFGISRPFSWRGAYAEVAFEMLEQPMTKEEILANIEFAYTETFRGYKGGEFRYNDHTNTHFETNCDSWSAGDYVSRWITKIEERDQEKKLIKLAFCNN